MHAKPTLAVLLTFAMLNACAHNPARALEPNAEEVKVLEPEDNRKKVPAGFTRGEDTLDEQEFYSVIGDTQSLSVVESSRSAGEIFQTLAVGLVVAGILTAASGLAMYWMSTNSDPTANSADPAAMSAPPILQLSQQTSMVPLAVAIGGGVMTAGGFSLFAVGKPKALGSSMLFDFAHAQGSLEKSLYGDKGLSPDFIRKVSFSTEDGVARMCSAGETRLTALEATDEKGRQVRISDRADWFSWSTTPTAPLRDLPMLEGKPVGKALASPLNTSLAQLDSTVRVIAMVKDSGVKSELLLEHDLGCPGRELDFSGAWGAYGSAGSSGRSGSSGSGDGGDGQDGAEGVAGERGPSLKVEAAWVTSPTRGRLLLVAVGSQLALVDPAKAGKVVIEATGGKGGSGGAGGRGGRGGDGKPQSCMNGGDGGRGGRGGSGGAGGPGGHITLKLADASIARLLSVRASGGEGGRGGDAGSGGSGGSRASCKSATVKEGNRGPAGASGRSGPSGPTGVVETVVAAPQELKLIAAALATNPTVALEGGKSGSGADRTAKK